jgi:hypothetical protein
VSIRADVYCFVSMSLRYHIMITLFSHAFQTVFVWRLPSFTSGLQLVLLSLRLHVRPRPKASHSSIVYHRLEMSLSRYRTLSIFMLPCCAAAIDIPSLHVSYYHSLALSNNDFTTTNLVNQGQWVGIKLAGTHWQTEIESTYTECTTYTTLKPSKHVL